jgi:phosphoglycerate kinase
VAKLSISDLDLAGKRLFMRVDFNVPIKEGSIKDDTRIRASLPSIRHALNGGATLVLASHLGRPKGKPRPEMSLRPIAAALEALLGEPVMFAEDCVGDPARDAVEKAHGGSARVVLLENLRFHPEEEKNDPAFAGRLAELADLYVNDAFGSSHRAHASVEAMTKHFHSAAAGFLMEKEVEYLSKALESPERPFVAVLGGAKVSDKLEIIENLLGRVDALLVGGAMAYTFLKSRGLPVGRSLVEEDKLEAARNISGQAEFRNLPLRLPSDHVVTDRIEAGAAAETLSVGDAAIADRMAVDIGPETVRAYTDFLTRARTVVWNGPMGVFEVEPFDRGTTAIARAVAAVQGTTIVGGGDSIAAVAKADVSDRISHISTGGGASLEYLGGRTLPGVAALSDKRT